MTRLPNVQQRNHPKFCGVKGTDRLWVFRMFRFRMHLNRSVGEHFKVSPNGSASSLPINTQTDTHTSIHLLFRTRAECQIQAIITGCRGGVWFGRNPMNAVTVSRPSHDQQVARPAQGNHQDLLGLFVANVEGTIMSKREGDNGIIDRLTIRVSMWSNAVLTCSLRPFTLLR